MLLSGCNKQETLSRDVLFSTDIRSFNVKATDTAFDNGDEIGLFAGAPIGKNNVKGTVSGTRVLVDEANPIQWMSGQTDPTDFVGYYPYNAALEDASAYDFAVATDQSAEGAYTASDLMVASAKGNPPSGGSDDAVVHLGFKHVLSKVIIKIDNQAGKSITGVSLLNIANAAKFNLHADGTEVAASVGAAQPQIKAAKGADDVYQLLTVPQGAQPLLKVEVAEGEAYVFSLASAFTFAPGKKYTAEVTLAGDIPAGEVTFTLEVSDWEDAAENPVFGEGQVTVVRDKWSVIGKLMGTNWNEDFVMTDGQDDSWSIDITYAEGDEFKFRFNGEWTYQYGMWQSDENETITADAIAATTADNKTYGLADGIVNDEQDIHRANKNIKLPEAGDYTLRLFTYGDHAGDLYVTKK